jgi:hypothetical protein
MRFGNAKGKRQGRELNPLGSVELVGLTPAPEPQQYGSTNLIPEARIVFDTAAGHAHDGADSRQVSYANLTNRAHGMDDHTGTGTFADIASAGAVGTGTLPARVDHTHKGVFTVKKSGGDDIHGSILLAEGSGITITQVGNTLTLAATATSHNLLSATHPDCAVGTVVRGDVIIGSGVSPAWTRLGKGSTNTVFKMGVNEPGWGTVALAEVSGTISGSQHGTQASVAGTTADHTGTLSATARTAFYISGLLYATRRELDLTPGLGINFGPSDDAINDRLLLTLNSQGREVIGGWHQADTSAAPTSAGLMAHVTGLSPQRMWAAGNLVGIAVTLSGDVGTSGDTYTVEVYELSNDSDNTYTATGITATVTGADIGTQLSAVGTGDYAFSATSRLAIFETAGGTPAARVASAYLLVVWN